MYLFVVALHVTLCLILILVILLQPGKGSDPGAAFGGGGGSGSMFGPRGPASLLMRATTVVAVLFMVTSITLALYSNRRVMEGGDVEDELERLQQLDGGAATPAGEGGDAPANAPAEEGDESAP